MATRGLYKWIDRFMRPLALTTTPTGNEFGWTVKDTSSAGTPTYTATSAGMVATLAASDEAEVVTIYQNNVLPYLLNKIRRVEFTIAMTVIPDAVTILTAGLASAQHDTPDSVATNCWFRMQGDASVTAVVCETDDTVTDNDDKATGATLATVMKRFAIDFSQGLSDVRFFIDGQPVATATRFDMSGASASQCVQLFFQLQKASGTGVPALTIRDVMITGIFADG